jgi:methionyl-tRNA formyltransferase
LAGLDICKDSTLAAGEVALCDEKIAIGTKEGTILVGALQLEGKKKQTAKEFVCGYPDFINSILD